MATMLDILTMANLNTLAFFEKILAGLKSAHLLPMAVFLRQKKHKNHDE